MPRNRLPERSDDAGDGLWVDQYGTRSRAADLMGPKGQIEDFIPRPGDSPYVPKEKRGRWGRRAQIATADVVFNATNGGTRPGNSVTLIDTGDLPHAVPINVQIRYAGTVFAGNATVTQPAPNAFAQVPPFLTTSLLWTVRRATSVDAPVAIDQFTQTLGAGGLNDVAPFDVVMSRGLAIDVQIPPTAGSGTLWLEAIATPVMVGILPTGPVPGLPQASMVFFPLVVSPARTQIIVARRARNAWSVVNTSATQPAVLHFGQLATYAAGAGMVGQIVLAPGGLVGAAGSRYDSPPGGYNGNVSITWAAAGGANDGALVSETSFL